MLVKLRVTCLVLSLLGPAFYAFTLFNVGTFKSTFSDLTIYIWPFQVLGPLEYTYGRMLTFIFLASLNVVYVQALVSLASFSSKSWSVFLTVGVLLFLLHLLWAFYIAGCDILNMSFTYAFIGATLFVSPFIFFYRLSKMKSASH